MPHKNTQQLLPHRIINLFNLTFTIYQFFIHFHHLSKKTIHINTPLNYNFTAFLTLDKSRKIIRQKQDQFMAQIISKIQSELDKFKKPNQDQKDLFKISYSQLQKFIQIFQLRKNQFPYFQKAFNQLQENAQPLDSVKLKNKQMINKMKIRLDQFQQKLIILVKKYEQRKNMGLLKKINPSFFYKVQKSNQLINKNPITIQSLTNNYSLQKQQNKQDKTKITKQKSESVKKIGQNASNHQILQQYKKQIVQLKSKYYRLNCKTDYSSKNDITKNILNRKNISKTEMSKHFTQPDVQNNNILKKEVQTAASQMKFSIRYTQQKKKSQLDNSFSIFDKTTHAASFFVRNSTKLGNIQDLNINQKQNISQNTLKNNSTNFLRKKSSLLKNSSNYAQLYNSKKNNNSVYRQTNFSVEAKRKSNQKRVSTAKVRQSLLKNSQQKSYFIRTSQTQANINIEGNNEQKDEIMFENIQELQKQVIEQDKNKIQQNLSDRDSQVNSINGGRNKNKKAKNRRKAFSKKHIDLQDDNQSNFVPTVVDIKRNSSFWNENNKLERSYNRTSFFRTSGYIPKKSMAKIGKARFNNINKKLVHKDSKDLFSQSVIQNNSTQKTIKHRNNHRDRTKRFYIKSHQMAVTVKDCIQLNQQIKTQSKLDEKYLNQNYLLLLMRQKYDSNDKQRQEDEDENNKNTFGGIKFRIIETDYDEDRKNKWVKSDNKLQQIDLSHMISRKFNQLGQKNMQGGRNSWDNELQFIQC